MNDAVTGEFLLDLFVLVIDGFNSYFIWMITPIRDSINFPGIFDTFWENAVETLNLGGATILDLMLGLGLPLFCAITILKWLGFFKISNFVG